MYPWQNCVKFARNLSSLLLHESKKKVATSPSDYASCILKGLKSRQGGLVTTRWGNYSITFGKRGIWWRGGEVLASSFLFTSFSELHFAGREGLLLHGHGTVATQHCNSQLPLPLVGLLIPLMHCHRVKSRDQGHLGGRGKRSFNRQDYRS